MNTLTEIEAAVDVLPPEQKDELLLFLAARIRAEADEPPPPQSFSRSQIEQWIADDEEGMRDFLTFQ